MKFCPKCARGYDDSFYYCLQDGSYLTDRDPEDTIVRPLPPTQPYTPKDEKTIENPFKADFAPTSPPQPYLNPKRGVRFFTVVIALCGLSYLIALGVVWSERSHSSPDTPQYNPPATASTPPPTPDITKVSTPLINESFEIRSGWHNPVPFTVPSNIVNARVVGGFRVTDGKSINFMIFTKSVYEAHGGAISDFAFAPAVYKRIGASSAKISAVVSSGDHYLVFDNNVTDYSGPQTVAAEFYLKYEEK